jgi:hypothetical protein
MKDSHENGVTWKILCHAGKQTSQEGLIDIMNEEDNYT